jgi:hypothetical protein
MQRQMENVTLQVFLKQEVTITALNPGISKTSPSIDSCATEETG